MSTKLSTKRASVRLAIVPVDVGTGVSVGASSAKHIISDLPARWQAVLAGASAEVIGVLADAHHALVKNPLQAARNAEALFRWLGPQAGAPAWLAFTIVVDGRIQTLSDFHGLDPLLDAYLHWRDHLDLPENLLQELDVHCFGALVFRRPGHQDMATLASCALAVFEQEGDAFLRLSAANYLLLYRIWRGDLLGADTLGSRIIALREQTQAVRSRLLSHSMMAMLRRLFLDYAESYQETEAGLALAEQSGIHYWDSHFHMQGAFLALTRFNLAEARDWLDKMEKAAAPEQYLDRSGYHYSRAWLHILADEMPLAQRHAQESVVLAEKSGAVFPQAVTHLGLAQVYLEQHKIGRAIYHTGRARRIGKVMDSRYVPFARGLARAHLAFRLGMKARGEGILQTTLKLGREQYYVNYPWWRGDVMAQLCARALAAGIEPDYTRMLIRKRRLQPPCDQTLDNWYWPLRVQVITEGKAELDGVPLELGGKGRELLLLLATLGDGERPVARETLQDRLWPDSDGDRAKQALDTAIHRLRRQLGTESMILTRPGSVALNPSLCQVDYWCLLRDLSACDEDPARFQRLLQAMPWLADREDQPILPKESLRRRITQHLLDRLGQVPPQTAEDWLETLLEVQPDSERLWQALIRHHLQQGYPAAARKAWERCQASLQRHTGMAPSAQTRILVEQGIGNLLLNP